MSNGQLQQLLKTFRTAGRQDLAGQIGKILSTGRGIATVRTLF